MSSSSTLILYDPTLSGTNEFAAPPLPVFFKQVQSADVRSGGTSTGVRVISTGDWYSQMSNVSLGSALGWQEPCSSVTTIFALCDVLASQADALGIDTYAVVACTLQGTDYYDIPRSITTKIVVVCPLISALTVTGSALDNVATSLISIRRFASDHSGVVVTTVPTAIDIVFSSANTWTMCADLIYKREGISIPPVDIRKFASQAYFSTATSSLACKVDFSASAISAIEQFSSLLVGQGYAPVVWGIAQSGAGWVGFLSFQINGTDLFWSDGVVYTTQQALRASLANFGVDALLKCTGQLTKYGSTTQPTTVAPAPPSGNVWVLSETTAGLVSIGLGAPSSGTLSFF